jgi:hypothetical protein
MTWDDQLGVEISSIPENALADDFRYMVPGDHSEYLSISLSFASDNSTRRLC